MSVRKLERSEWRHYFDLLSRVTLIGRRAEIEVMSLEFGVQIAVEWGLLLGIVYDDRDDVIEIITDGLDHLIARPLEIHVDEHAAILGTFEVVDKSQVRHIVQLRDPLMLPPPLGIA